MPKSYLFDTSFLISILDNDDINHSQALETIGHLEIGGQESRFFINDIILNETYTVFNYKKGFSSLSLLENFLSEMEVIRITSNNDEYLSFFKILSTKISVADSSVIYDSLKHRLVILTFDKEMITISKRYIH